MSVKWLAFSLLQIVCTDSALAQASRPATPTFSPSQEVALFSASKMVAAAERCDGVKLNDGKLSAMLEAAGISERDMHLKQRSNSLKESVQSYASSFRGNKDQVCSEALSEGRQNGLLEPSPAVK